MLRKIKHPRVITKKDGKKAQSARSVLVNQAARDEADLEDAVRLMSDPKEVPLDYEQARKKLGLD